MTAQVLVGDCLDVMPTLEADSVDAIVTDPPYGLKFMGKAWDHGVPGVAFWDAAKRVAKPGAHLVAFGGTRTHHRLMCAIEDAGWEIRDCLSYLYGSGFPKSHNGPWGGTALKPAWEPIVLARKPLVGTVAGNVDRFGTGALNISACRIGTDPHVNSPSGSPGANSVRLQGGDGRDAENARRYAELSKQRPQTVVAGRWPANVVLDEDAAALLDEASGTHKSGVAIGGNGNAASIYGTPLCKSDADDVGYHDVGGASRFFYTSKASRSERNAGLDGFAEQAAPSEDYGTKRVNLTRKDLGTNEVRATRNAHPTVKPLDLMQWLCRLVTPKGGLILDPFCGSGSTGRAAVAEGFRFIGVEEVEEYAAIARARIAEYAPLFGEIA